MGVLSDRMRRAFSLMICVAAAAVTAAAESPLLNFVPAGADFLVFADLGQLRSRTGFDKMLESSPAVRELLDDFEARYRVRLDHCSELLWAGDGKRLRGLLIRTDLPEARFRQGLRDGGTRFSLKKYGEREVLLVEAGSAIAQEQLRLGLCYLEQNSVLAAEERGLELFFAGLQPRGMGCSAFLVPDGAPLLWGACNLRAMLSPAGKPVDPVAGAFFRNVRRAMADVRLAAAGGWSLRVRAECNDEKSAAMLAAALPGYLAMGAGLFFAGYPQLASDVIAAFRARAQRNFTVAELRVDGALARRLGEFLRSEAARRIIPPDPVPPDLQQRRAK